MRTSSLKPTLKCSIAALATLCLLSISSIKGQSLLHKKSTSTIRIALLGCHRQFQPAPALAKYPLLNPDLCLWVGDNIYADTSDPAFLDSCYQALAAKPAFRILMDKYPYLATWDDHDFGDNDENKGYSLKDTSKILFRKFWNLAEKIPADQPGIYYSDYLESGDKRIQIILLDVRYNRDEPNIPNGEMLGEAQWKWLEQELRKKADLRLIVSGTQILLDRDSGSETWEQYPTDRKRLMETIQNAQAEGVLFITGDQHYGEVAREKGALGFDAIELQFSGINQIESPEFNSYRVSSVCKSLHSYAFLDIQLDTTDTDLPHLNFQIYDASSDELEVSYRVNMDELQLAINSSSQPTFVGKHEIRLSQDYPGLTMRFTTDGSSPTKNSQTYEVPFFIENETLVKVALFSQKGFRRSPIKEFLFKEEVPISSVDIQANSGGLGYTYFEGQFEELPDFSTLSPLKQGIANSFDLQELAGKEDHFALVFEGFINIEKTGMYTFQTRSDDGSALYVHDRLVVDNDGSHSKRSRSGQIALKKGRHPIRITYFEDYMGESLEVRYQGPNISLQKIPFQQFYFKDISN